MHKILMVCTGNICRSPMAEGVLKSMLPENMKKIIEVSSAGTNALDGNQAEPNAIQAMQEFGIDITEHIASSINKKRIGEADFIFVMEQRHKVIIDSGYDIEESKIYLLSEFNQDKNLDEIFDPYGESLEVYRDCASIISECIGEVIRFLVKKQGN